MIPSPEVNLYPPPRGCHALLTLLIILGGLGAVIFVLMRHILTVF